MKNGQENRILLHFFLPREKHELVQAAKRAKPPQLLGELQNTNTLNHTRAAGGFLPFSQKKSSADSTNTGFSPSPPAFRLHTSYLAFHPAKSVLHSLRPTLRDIDAELGGCLLVLSVAVLIS